MATEKIGRYQIKEEIGHSKTSVVYRAFDTQANRDVVVKVFAFEPTGNVTLDLSIKAHFRRELKMIASLEHAAIVPVYDVGEHEGQPYFVMRYMAGGSLNQMISSHGKLSLAETANIIDRVALALAHAHEKNIIHRDIKPDNILFDAEGHPYISDFGVAQPAVSADSTMVEGDIGTPGYMSPEQAKHDDVDERSDVYSLGVVIYQMLTGKNLNQPVPDILNEVPELPPEMDEIMKISLAEKRRDRYVSILHLSRALKRAAFGEEDRPATFFARNSNWAAIRTSLVWIIVSVAALLGFFWMFANGGNIPFLSAASTPTISLDQPSTNVSSTDTATSKTPTAMFTEEPTSTVEPTPTITIPGGADQVALTSGNDLYLMNIDGSNLVQVRTENSLKSNVQWISGNRLVYISRNCAYMVDAETKQTEQLSCFPSSELLEGFSVSPDGKLVAITIQRTLNIFPFDVDILKTIKSRFELASYRENCFYNQVPFREVLWSKDETRLSAHVIETRMVNSDQIFLMNADIANCKNVELGRVDTIPGGRINFESDSSRHLGSFDWNGKNSFLLNDAVRNDGFGNLYLYNSETREMTKVNPINGQCCYRDPRWSPDGTYIMFAYQRFDRSAIELYYIPFADLQGGGPFTPVNLPNGFFSTSREKPQPALRPIP